MSGKAPEKSASTTKILKKISPAPSKSRKKTSGGASFPEPLTGDAISAWRSSLGETQVVFAARFQVTAASISQWEKKGKNVIGVQVRTLSALRMVWEMTHR